MTNPTPVERDAYVAFESFWKRVVISQAQFTNEFTKDLSEHGPYIEICGLVEHFLNANPQHKQCREVLLQLNGGPKRQVMVRQCELTSG